MPEAGYIPIPKKLGRKGVRDMVRISDGRMSGTAGGAVVLHVTPEAAVGGPLAAVRNGDRIRLDVGTRALELLVDDEEIQFRLQAFTIERQKRVVKERGYKGLYKKSVLQADQGADFDFLRYSAGE